MSGTSSYLFLVVACSAFCSSYLILINCQLYLAVVLCLADMLPGLVGCAHTIVVWLTHMAYTWILNVQLSTLIASSMLLCGPQTPTPHGPVLRNRIACSFQLLLCCRIFSNLTFAFFYLTSLGRSGALHGEPQSCCGMLSLWSPQIIQYQLPCWHYAS